MSGIGRRARKVRRAPVQLKPGDLPLQSPDKFEFVINLKTAESLNIQIPPGVLAIADAVIE